MDCGVTRLVYTSTYNVVFGGQEIHNGDESIPYLPMDKVSKLTSRLKFPQLMCQYLSSSLGTPNTEEPVYLGETFASFLPLVPLGHQLCPDQYDYLD